MPLRIAETDWETLIAEASRVRQPKGPERFLAAVSARKNPLAEDNAQEKETSWQAYQADLRAIYEHSQSQHPLSDEEREVWIDRLAWLLRTLEACHQERPSKVNLIAILRVASAFAIGMRIWQRLPSEYFSDNLLAAMAALVGATEYSFSAGGRPEPVWEREAVDHFLEADKDGDWPKIESLWRTVAPAVRGDGYLVEAVACLCACEKGHHALAMALDASGSILPIMCATNTMSPEQIGHIIPHLKSDRARFVSVQSLAFDLPRNEPLSSGMLDNLVTLFRLVQRNGPEWRKWMRAFNRYPVRTKPLQPALGRSLAGSGVDAKAGYIEAIDLSTTHGECREAVTICMSEFRRVASREERQILWTMAFQRWEEWNFDVGRKDFPLTRLAVSDLDFALVGYGVECLSDGDLQIMVQALATELNAVQNRWFSDRVAFDAAWYRALSRWQIFTYTAGVRSGKYEWGASLKVLMPFDPKTDRYFAMSLGTNLH
jgi:hypothetical protein